MGEISTQFFVNFFIYLAIPFGIAVLLRKFRISPMLGFIVGGMIVGNFFGGLLSRDTINGFAYFGIIMLLFVIGLEINFEKIIALKKFIFIAGFVQIIASIVLIVIISLFFSFTLLQAILIGIAAASSSTNIVAKLIQERGEEHSLLGELAIGILLFQDLAFIPFVIFFTVVSREQITAFTFMRDVVFSLIQAVIILTALYVIGKMVVPGMFDRIARASRDLLNFFVIVFIFGIALIASLFQIPVYIAIFIAGVLVSQTIEHQHIFSQVRPMRDVLATIFFIYIGMSISFGSLSMWSLPTAIIFMLSIAVGKALIIFITFLLLKFNTRMSFSLGAYLFQIDEDAFILLSFAFAHGLFTQEQYVFLITTIVLSLLITPLFIAQKDKAYTVIRNWIRLRVPMIDGYIKHRLDFDPSPIDVLPMRNHIVICGYGRIGMQVGRALILAHIPYVAIDYNIYTVQKARKEGVTIIYGDPSDIDVLDYAETEHASAIICAVPERFAQESIILNAKKLNPHIIVIGRAHTRVAHARMKDLGAHIVVQPEVEASLSIVKNIFLLKRMDKTEILDKLRQLRLEQGGYS